MAAPFDVGAALEIARCNREAANSADDARVGKLGLCRDDAIRDIVVDCLIEVG